MHKHFAEWYRKVSIEPDGNVLLKRWAGVDDWAIELSEDHEKVLETVRIFQGLPSKASMEPFLKVFRKHDAAFPQHNGRELQVLAGASLVALVEAGLESDDDVHSAVIAGSAVESSRLYNPDASLADIASEIADCLSRLAVGQRARRTLDADAILDQTEAAKEALKDVVDLQDIESLTPPLSLILENLLGAIETAVTELSDASHNVRCADEETNILWWLAGGCSRDTDEPWNQLKEGAAIIAGTELADLTEPTLGPRDATALLERILVDSKTSKKEFPFAKYVDALPDGWARDRGSKAEACSIDLTPLTLAVVNRGKSGKSNWQHFFDNSGRLKSSTPLTATRVARQAYVEAILLRTLADADTED
jgi:hypothetical protein